MANSAFLQSKLNQKVLFVLVFVFVTTYTIVLYVMKFRPKTNSLIDDHAITTAKHVE